MPGFKKPPQFRKCRLTFAMEVNAAVVSCLVLLGLSLKEHPSEDRQPCKGKETLTNTQELQVSKGLNAWQWVNVTTWLRSWQQLLPDLQLPLRHLKYWCNLTATATDHDSLHQLKHILNPFLPLQQRGSFRLFDIPKGCLKSASGVWGSSALALKQLISLLTLRVNARCTMQRICQTDTMFACLLSGHLWSKRDPLVMSRKQGSTVEVVKTPSSKHHTRRIPVWKMHLQSFLRSDPSHTWFQYSYWLSQDNRRDGKSKTKAAYAEEDNCLDTHNQTGLLSDSTRAKTEVNSGLGKREGCSHHFMFHARVWMSQSAQQSSGRNAIKKTLGVKERETSKQNKWGSNTT